MSQIVEFPGSSGLASGANAYLFASGSDTVVATASAVAEGANAKSRYAATFTSVAAGTYDLVAADSTGAPFCIDVVVLGAGAGTYPVQSLSPITVGNVTVGGYAAGQDPATLVLDVAASGHNTAGTIGHAINAAGSASDPLVNPVPGAYASGTAGWALGRIGTAAINVTDIIDDDGTLNLIQGADYYAADGLSVDITDAGNTWVDLATATACQLWITNNAGDLLGPVAGSFVTRTGTNKKIRFELTRAQVLALPLCPAPGVPLLDFACFATLANGHSAPLGTGKCRVAKGATS